MSFEFGSFHLPTLFVCNTLELAHQVDFLLDVENHKVRKVLDLDFWKKALTGLEEPKMIQKWPKNELFLGFDKNLIHSYVLFYFSMGLLIFYKYLMFGKNLVLELWFKRSRPIRMQDSLTYIFFSRLDIHKKICMAISSGCCRYLLSVVITNSESALSQEWVELWS